jgi:cytochrome c oxidase cbb3-type subunit 2
MPGYPWLATTVIDGSDMGAHLKALRIVGVPYTDDAIANATADFVAQANPDGTAEGLLTRYPKATVRNFSGDTGKITELTALIAYLQVLGTMVNFSTFDEPANQR